MSQDLRPLVIYRYHDGALSPNPWKVIIFFYELNLPFEMIPLDRYDPDIRKKAPLVSITPNGRMPALHDPNTGAKLWESGAIIEYLLDVYDIENRLSYTNFPEKYEQSCGKHFQMSGQGPYYGQRSFFLYLHSESLPSAKERYADEIKRILGVIDVHMMRTGRPYLVGDHLCFVDLMFVPWDSLRTMVLMSKSFEDAVKHDFPNFWAWQQRVFEMESVKMAHKFVTESSAAAPGYESKIDVESRE